MKRFHFLYLILFSTVQSFAVHVIGGDLIITQIKADSNLYEIIHTIIIDNQYAKTIEKKSQITSRKLSNDTIIEKITLDLFSSKKIEYEDLSCMNYNSSSADIMVLIYKKSLSLSEMKYSQPVYFYSESCCRDTMIINIKEPEKTAMISYLEFPGVKRHNIALNNSSPKFSDFKTEYVCVGKETILDFSATDIDGDELRYELSEPLSDVLYLGTIVDYNTVQWKNGSGLNRLFFSGSININENTGKMTLISHIRGQILFSVKCSEYRDNIKIGEIRRDYEVFILSCPPSTKPKISIAQHTLLSPNSLGIFYIKNNEDFIETASVDSATLLKVTFKPLNFDQNKIRITGNVKYLYYLDTLKSKFSWGICNGDDTSKIYRMVVTVTNNTCPRPSTDTMLVRFKVLLPMNMEPSVTLEPNITQKNMIIGVDDEDKFKVSSFHTDSNTIALQGLYNKILINGDSNISKYGYQVDTKKTNGSITSNISFKPTCELLNLGTNYKLQYITQEYCDVPLNDTLTLYYQISDIAYSKDSLFISNVFTPNNDGLNDIFYLKGLPPDRCADTFESAAIYNRWGKKVFETAERNLNWTGNESESGIYFFEIKYKKAIYKGTVELKR